MKNFKKLNRHELKTISGNGLLDNFGSDVLEAAFNTGNNLSCILQCTVNGVISVKLLPCKATC